MSDLNCTGHFLSLFSFIFIVENLFVTTSIKIFYNKALLKVKNPWNVFNIYDSLDKRDYTIEKQFPYKDLTNSWNFLHFIMMGWDPWIKKGLSVWVA